LKSSISFLETENIDTTPEVVEETPEIIKDEEIEDAFNFDDDVKNDDVETLSEIEPLTDFDLDDEKEIEEEIIAKENLSEILADLQNNFLLGGI
jgi:hypothetical protein